MQYVIRRWNCSCGRSNATEVSLDGKAKCDHCAVTTQIQPSQAQGGETPAALAAFLQVDARGERNEGLRRDQAAMIAARAAAENEPPPLRTSFSYPFPPTAPPPAPPVRSSAVSRERSESDGATDDELLIEFLREDR